MCPGLVDGLLGGALALLGIANLRHDFTLPSVSALPPGSSPTECNPVLEAVGFICVIAVFAVRRANPYLSWLGLLALNLAMPAGILLLGSGRAGAVCVIFLLAPAMLLGMPILLATIAALRSASASWVCTALCLAYPITAGLLEGTHDGRRTSIFIIFQLLLNAMGVLVGLNLRSQRERLIEIEERSARMALAREQTALLAAANERSRIAREMHDVVAHSLAVMITMADGATAAIDRNPQMARQALEALSEAGRSALADTRRLVGVLRDDPGASSDPGAARPDARPRPAGAPDSPVDATAREHGRPAVASGPGSARLSAPPPAGRPSGPHHSGDPTPGWARRVRLLHRLTQGGAGRTTPASGIPVVKELPVPEFAPPGTVAPREPSEQIEQLRRHATDLEADRSTGGTPLAPAPETGDLEVLVRRFQSAGVPVELTWSGPPLPEDKGLQLTVFRIAQESLTNVLRYAPTTRQVRVDVQRHTGTALLTVENQAAPGSTPVHGSGKGIIGMRERAAVYGGTVDAGPTATGWRVRAVVRWDEDEEGDSPWQLPH